MTTPGDVPAPSDRPADPGVVRPLRSRDVPEVLALNELEVDKLAPLDEARLWHIHALADRFDVVELAGTLAAFVVTVPPGVDYDSVNYRWYAQRYGERFYYLDRVVTHPRSRRRGLGTRLYDALEERARAFGRLALEVNLEPPNEASLAFHSARGYEPVGELADDDGHRRVMLVKELG